MKLDVALVKKLAADDSDKEKSCLDLSAREIDHIEDLSSLGSSAPISRLDLSRNSLSKAKNIAGLFHLTSIRHLNLSNNGLDNIEPLLNLSSLVVLNVSNNSLTSLPKAFKHTLDKLQALILNGNSFSAIDLGTSVPESLNTLILSHNHLKRFSCSGGSESRWSLKKIQLAHNEIKDIVDIHFMTSLIEFRINDNEISAIRENFLPTSLRILDIGNNLIPDLDSLQGILKLEKLHNLNIRKNPLASVPDHRKILFDSFLHLWILDGANVRKGEKPRKSTDTDGPSKEVSKNEGPSICENIAVRQHENPFDKAARTLDVGNGSPIGPSAAASNSLNNKANGSGLVSRQKFTNKKKHENSNQKRAKTAEAAGSESNKKASPKVSELGLESWD